MTVTVRCTDADLIRIMATQQVVIVHLAGERVPSKNSSVAESGGARDERVPTDIHNEEDQTAVGKTVLDNNLCSCRPGVWFCESRSSLRVKSCEKL